MKKAYVHRIKIYFALYNFDRIEGFPAISPSFVTYFISLKKKSDLSLGVKKKLAPSNKRDDFATDQHRFIPRLKQCQTFNYFFVGLLILPERRASL